MPLLWLVTGLCIGLLDVIFGNVLLIGIAMASVTTGIVALFLSPVYLQVSVFFLLSCFFLWLCWGLALKRAEEQDRSMELASVLHKEVTVHYWDGKDTKVQLNGRVWPAEFAEYGTEQQSPGRYRVWKVFRGHLILTK